MKLLIYLLTIFLVQFHAYGQSIPLQVIANSGDYFISNESNIHWTLGELAVEEYENDHVLTQGFQQVFITVTDVYANPATEIIINTYPNPVSDLLTIETPEPIDLKAILFDIHGSAINSTRFSSFKSQLSLSDVTPGMYLLCFYKQEKLIRTFKIQKSRI